MIPALPDLDLTHRVVGHIHDKKITRLIEAQLMRQIKSQHSTPYRRRPNTPFSRSRPLCGDGPVRSNPPDPLTRIFAKPNRAIRPAHDSKGIINLRLNRRAAIAPKSLDPVSCEGLDCVITRKSRATEEA